MSEHNIKADNIQVREIISATDLKILVKDILSYVEEQDLDPLDLVYRQWVDQKLESLAAAYEIESTFAEMSSLSQNAELISGLRYIMTDYYTRHSHPSDRLVIHNGSTEPIILTASSTTGFETIAQSMYYTEHILEYSFNRIHCDVPTPNANSLRPGVITARYDPRNRVDCGFDYIGCVTRKYMILDKLYREVSKIDDTTFGVTITTNMPNIVLGARHEIRVPIVTHSAGQKELTITYNNGTITKPLKYYLDQTPTGILPENHLSDLKCTAVYNPEIDAFVLMSFINIGEDLIGTYSASKKTNEVYGDITYIVDGNDFEDFPVFSSTAQDVKIGREYDLYRPSVAFKGTAIGVSIPGACTFTTFTKNINGFRVGSGVYLSIIDSPEQNHNTENYISDTLLLDSSFAYSYVDHSFKTLSRAVITPCANMNLGAVDLVSIIFEKSGAFTCSATMQQTDIFVTGKNIGSVPNNFYITAPIFNSLIGFFDANNLIIAKALTGVTLYTRNSLVDALLGRIEIDGLTFKVSPASTSGPTVPLALNEQNEVVLGDQVLAQKSFPTIALRDAYEVTRLPFQAFIEDDGDGKWAEYRATAIGLPGTYLKTMDQDLFAAAMSGAQVAAAYESFEDVERFTTTFMTKLIGIQEEAEKNDSPEEITTKINSIVDEADKLDHTAVKITPIDEDRFYVDEVSGRLVPYIDLSPVKDSLNRVDSGALYNFFASFFPGFAFDFVQSSDTKLLSMRKLLARNGVFYMTATSGASTRLYSSPDARHFYPGGDTGNIAFYSFDLSTSGVLILAGRDSGPNNLLRSINLGKSFTPIAAPGTYEFTDIKHVGQALWTACARTGEIVYSNDDGLTWLDSTVPTWDNGGTPTKYAFQGINSRDGLIFAVADLGTNRFHISTDFGVTFTAKSTGANRTFRGCGMFNGFIYIWRGGDSSGGYVTISSNQGDSWTEKMLPPSSSQSINCISQIGEYLYFAGENGMIIRTKDFESYETLPAYTTNTISGIAQTSLNGRPVAMFICDNGASGRIFTTVK